MRELNWGVVFLLSLETVCLQAAEPGKAESDQMIKTPGIRKGLCLLIEDIDGGFAEELSDGGVRVVHGISSDRKAVDAAREFIFQRGKYGKVSFDVSELNGLPYADNLANIVVVEDFGKLKAKGVTMDEVVRVLAPYGTAFVKGFNGTVPGTEKGESKSGSWIRYTKELPEGMDEWTHFERDPTRMSVSQDPSVGPPTGLRWVSQDLIYPTWGWGNASPLGFVSGNGRNFYWYGSDAQTRKRDELGKSMLVCRDAFNGLLLWERAIDRPQQARSLIAAGDLLIVQEGGGGGLVALDAATGKLVRTFEDAKNVRRFQGELLLDDGVLVQAANGIRAMSVDNGKLIWEKPNKLDWIDMLLIGSGNVFYLDHEGENQPVVLVCCHLKTGKEHWRQTQPMRFRKSRHSKSLSLISLYRDMIIMGSGSREEFIYGPSGPNTFGATYAVSATNGRLLWSYEYDVVDHKGRPTDVFPIGDSLWVKCRDKGQGYFFAELDAATGKEKQKFEGVLGRCYGDHAVNKYIITGGFDFLDTQTGEISYFGAARGTCDTGSISANSLTYAFPVRCHCFNLVRGFLGLHSDQRDIAWPKLAEIRTEKGPAFGNVTDRPTRREAWPTLRHDTSRASCSTGKLGRNLKLLWEAKFGSRLSSPVVAAGMVFVTDIDNHRIVALDDKTGKTKWTVTAGGRVDSPPTVAQGMVVFGSADGRVTCLRATDGVLVWRLQAAPLDQRIMVTGQLESTWPVHGSVLVLGDNVYFAAGRNTQTDEGLHCYGVDLKTGRALWRTNVAAQVGESNSDILIAAKNPETGEDVITIGHRVYLNPENGVVAKCRPLSFCAPWGMLTDCTGQISFGTARYDYPRRMWSYGRLMAQFEASKPSLLQAKGYLLAIEEDRVFGTREKLNERQSHLVYEGGNIPSVIFCQKGKSKAWAVEIDGKLKKRAVVVTKDSLLFGCGSADGERGSVWHLAKETGEKLGETNLPAPPRWDGLAVAGGRLHVVSETGSVLVYAAY